MVSAVEANPKQGGGGPGHDGIDFWEEVQDAGSRLWLDTGDIEQASGRSNRSFEALTVNNTLLNKEVQKGIHNELIPEAAAAIRKALTDMGEKNLSIEIGFILNAYHCLRLVERLDAYVTVGLHTDRQRRWVNGGLWEAIPRYLPREILSEGPAVARRIPRCTETQGPRRPHYLHPGVFSQT